MVVLGMVFALVGYYLMPSMYQAKAPQLQEPHHLGLGQVVSDLKHWEVGAVDACLHWRKNPSMCINLGVYSCFFAEF